MSDHPQSWWCLPLDDADRDLLADQLVALRRMYAVGADLHGSRRDYLRGWFDQPPFTLDGNALWFDPRLIHNLTETLGTPSDSPPEAYDLARRIETVRRTESDERAAIISRTRSEPPQHLHQDTDLWGVSRPGRGSLVITVAASDGVTVFGMPYDELDPDVAEQLAGALISAAAAVRNRRRHAAAQDAVDRRRRAAAARKATT